MRVTLRCPVCDSGLRIDATAPPDQATCGGCGATIPLVVTDAVRADETFGAGRKASGANPRGTSTSAQRAKRIDRIP